MFNQDSTYGGHKASSCPGFSPYIHAIFPVCRNAQVDGNRVTAFAKSLFDGARGDRIVRFGYVEEQAIRQYAARLYNAKLPIPQLLPIDLQLRKAPKVFRNCVHLKMQQIFYIPVLDLQVLGGQEGPFRPVNRLKMSHESSLIQGNACRVYLCSAIIPRSFDYQNISHHIVAVMIHRQELPKGMQLSYGCRLLICFLIY